MAFKKNYLISCFLLCFAGASIANQNLLNQMSLVDGSDIDGQHGVIHVSGSLTESPCRLSMDSNNQSISIGNIPFSFFNNKNEVKYVSFNIELLDCLETQSELENFQTGNMVWSSSQPAIKARFYAVTEPFFTDVIKVNGVEGIGLKLISDDGLVVSMGNDSPPILINPGQNILKYNIMPIRTSGPMTSGAFSALIAFEMLYD